MNPLILLLAASTWFMTGVIWFVQIVHYPLFAKVGTNTFQEYQNKNVRLTGSVVAPPMVLEAFLSLWAAMFNNFQSSSLLWINFALVFMIWVLTALFSVPCHDRLRLSGFDESVHKRLVVFNWSRTLLWSLCSIIMTAFLLGYR